MITQLMHQAEREQATGNQVVIILIILILILILLILLLLIIIIITITITITIITGRMPVFLRGWLPQWGRRRWSNSVVPKRVQPGYAV